MADAPFDELLAALDRRPTVAGYQATARELIPVTGRLPRVRVALLASFTIDPLVPFLRVEAARLGFALDAYTAPLNTIAQELLDPASGCAAHAPEIVFVSQRLADVCPPLVDDFLALSPDGVDARIDETVAGIMGALRAYRERSAAAVVVGNFDVEATPLLGIYEGMADGSQTDAIRRLNRRLVEASRALPGVYVQDVDGLAAQVGRKRWHDAKMWSMARAPLSQHALPALAASHAAFVRALCAPARKCLVVDLDGTLWGGVLGEQGIGGIELGHTYPGSGFRRFQHVLLSLSRRGVLLAISSKNNPEEVDEVFGCHPDMVLRREHFSAVRVNWRDKAENVRDIAQELGLGLDALAFFDDSPVECALMRRRLPEVLTIQAPANVLDAPETLLRSAAFDRLGFTPEDRHRGEMYRRRADAQAQQALAGSLDDFLETLQTEVDIRPVDRLTFARALELTQKTNQFNLTGHRYSAAELADAMSAADRAAFSMRLLDRFGDHGVVGLAVVELAEDVASIETFLLSCRVIGRTAETALLSFAAAWARSRGARAIEGSFVATRKNGPAADFYARHGFAQIATAVPGATRWRLDAIDAGIAWPRAIACARVHA
jgi:FkbH-like protein